MLPIHIGIPVVREPCPPRILWIVLIAKTKTAALFPHCEWEWLRMNVPRYEACNKCSQGLYLLCLFWFLQIETNSIAR